MKEYIHLFNKHKYSIENFLTNIVQSETIDLNNKKSIDALFSHLDALQAVYFVNDNYKQISPNYYRGSEDKEKIGILKEHYFSNIRFNDKNIYITNPYLHHRTGKSSITVVRLIKDKFVIFDVDLLKLLEGLSLIEHNSNFDKFNRFVYGVGGYSLAVISLFLILYGGYIFVNVFFKTNTIYIIDDMFTSIIAITLGLAIFDLAKTIIAHEVLFKGIGDDKGGQYHILGKFLISIIIALSIESLMVVFKIALSDYTALGYAFFLIFGVAVMIYALGKFHIYTREKCEL
jgi:hypothetical protein